MRRTLTISAFVAVAAVALFILAAYFSDDHQRFLAWSAQRDAWHRKCDLYVGKSPAELGPQVATAAACQQELDEMTAYAKRQGWM